ncbi:hypothetical protein AB1Y20_001581 [Prymnesium parvum]|uniref:ShKT domain-containing protein n=1 Tax=Prymnesium parvum TaxID=97485 RepID=A0AB34KCF6_PRYPA
MSSVTLASGVQLPMVGFGCAGYVRRHELLQAIHAGYRMFDTAQAHEWYLEEELGAAWQASGVGRTELFFTSKLHPRDLGEQSTLDAFPNSLRRLNTTYLDAFLLHYPRCFGTLCAQPPQGTWKDSWRALEKLFADGRVRAIGVSNFSPQELEELLAVSTVKPHLVQSWMDPLHQERPLRSLCRRHNIQFQAYSTLGTQHHTSFNPVIKHPVLNSIGKEVGKSPAQVALRWALQHDAAVIPRSRNPGRMRANLELSEWQLSAEHMAAIDALDGSDPTLITLPLSPPLPCKDEEPGCARWAEDGECEKNPGFMLRACAGSCNSCHARDREL